MHSLDAFCLPFPGEPSFAALPASDQAWIERILPWYRAAATLISPRRALTHPMMVEFEQNPADWAQFVKFYRDSPVIFDLALRQVTGAKVAGKTAIARQKAWQAKLSKMAHSRPSKKAAE